MSLLRSTLTPLARNYRSIVSSSASRSSLKEVHPGYKQMQVKAGRFNVEDGNPSFIKGGIFDRIMYRLTMGLCATAFVWDCVLYYELSLR
uniref:Putative cytochrome c oxidase subunit viia mitochondrion n=1 Tax=Rhodnius neglectus TaxID=72488 RepID=A0A0P4VH02_9HEMI